MITKKTLIFLIFISFTILMPAKEYASRFMDMGAGAKAAGMGMSGVAIADDAYATYWNPAGLMNLNKMDINASYSTFFGIINRKIINYAHPFGDGVLGIDYISTWVDDIKNTTYTDNRPLDVGASFMYTASVFILSKAGKLSDIYKFHNMDLFYGISIKLMGEGFSEKEGGSGIGLDIGLQGQYASWLKWGINFQNIAKTSFEWDTPSKTVELIPTIIKTGIAWQVFPRIAYILDLDFQEGQHPKYHTGFEYKLVNTFMKNIAYTLRAGLDNSNVTFGLGLNCNNFKLDYAYRKNRYHYLDDSVLISIGFNNK